MSGNTTTIERSLEVLNKLWDAMYESGEVPTYAERCYYYLALKDAMGENAKLRELVRDMWPHVRYRSRMCGKCDLPCDTSDECLLYEPMRQRMHDLGIEVDDGQQRDV